MTKPILYHAPQTRGGTTRWMNEELGDVCDVRILDLHSGDQKAADYVALNPMGKVPTLVVPPDRGDVVVTESAAICAYLADAFPGAGLAPPTADPKRGVYYRWLFFSPSCVEPMMMDKLAGGARGNPGSAGHGSAEDVLAALRAAVTPGPYVLGDAFTAADVVLGSTLRFATMFGAIEKEPAFADYIARITSRDAFKRAEAKDKAYIDAAAN
ncbi:MAG: glutathione S-transferase family protein [Parvularculaceae bacterium]